MVWMFRLRTLSDATLGLTVGEIDLKADSSNKQEDVNISQYPGGRKGEKLSTRTRNERKGQFRLVKLVVILAVAVMIVGYVVISTLMKREPLTRMSSDSYQPSQEGVVTNSIGMTLVYIPANSFMMGSPPNEKGRESHEGPQHQVGISKAFWMGQTGVTQAQWRAVMGTRVGQQRDRENPSWPLSGEGADYPMYCVSWYEAVEFCRKLGQRENRTYRLPTEAEWEYACRVGSVGRFTFGDSE